MYVRTSCSPQCSSGLNPGMALRCVLLPTAGELFERVTARRWVGTSFFFLDVDDEPSSARIGAWAAAASF